MPLYAVTVQTFAETAEEAVRQVIVPGSVKEAEVMDLACQVLSPSIISVPEEEGMPE